MNLLSSSFNWTRTIAYRLWRNGTNYCIMVYSWSRPDEHLWCGRALKRLASHTGRHKIWNLNEVLSCMVKFAFSGLISATRALWGIHCITNCVKLFKQCGQMGRQHCHVFMVKGPQFNLANDWMLLVTMETNLMWMAIMQTGFTFSVLMLNSSSRHM